MILVEFTPEGGSLHRISNKDLTLTYPWDSYIVSLSSIKFSLKSVQGGYAKPTFSELKISPDFFENLTWPPASSADVVIKWTDTDEDSAITVFDGKAAVSKYDRFSVSYTLTQPEFDLTLTEGTSYTNTLVNIITNRATSLGLTTDTTNSRSTSPAVSYTLEADTQAIDFMSLLCEFFTHGFKIEDDVLYLYDMLLTTTPIDLTEYEFLPSSYRKATPLALIAYNSRSAPGSSPNGKEIQLNFRPCIAANAVDNLENIVTILEQDFADLKCMITDERPKILDTVSMYDESTIQPTSFTGIVTSVTYNFDSEVVKYEISGTAS